MAVSHSEWKETAVIPSSEMSLRFIWDVRVPDFAGDFPLAVLAFPDPHEGSLRGNAAVVFGGHPTASLDCGIAMILDLDRCRGCLAEVGFHLIPVECFDGLPPLDDAPFGSEDLCVLGIKCCQGLGILVVRRLVVLLFLG